MPDLRGKSSPNASGVGHDDLQIKDKRSPATHFGSSKRGVPGDAGTYVKDVRSLGSTNASGLGHAAW